MSTSRRPRHRALAVALATLLVPLVVGSAAAAPPGNRPAVTVTAGTPSVASLSVTAVVNRGTSDLASCSYVIDAGTAVSCGAPAATAKKSSRYTITLANQTAGDHTITVTVLLKDGGRASGSDDFTIAAQPPGVYGTSDNMRFVGFSERQSGEGGLSNINSDLAFQGARVYQGTFPGFRIVDISDPSEPEQLVNYTDCRHPSGQGDVVIYGDILVRSWDSASANGMPAGGWPCGDTLVQAGEEGLHVIDVSDPAQPDVETFIDLPCGSHTATAVPDLENDRLIIYSSASSGACDGIDVIEIPLDDPSQASYDHFDPAADLIACHDTAVILGDVLRAACAGGQGFAVWSLDPADGGSKIDPELLYTKNVNVALGKNITGGDSAGFSNDGTTLIFAHQPGGGTQPRCQATGTVLNDATGADRRHEVAVLLRNRDGRAAGPMDDAARPDGVGELRPAEFQRRAFRGEPRHPRRERLPVGLRSGRLHGSRARQRDRICGPGPARPERDRWGLGGVLLQRIDLGVRYDPRPAVLGDPGRRPRRHQHP